MAFTGTPTVVQISDRLVRITGLSLAATVSGTIKLHGGSGTPDLKLPASFQPTPYKADGNAVALQDCVQVSAEPNAVGTATAIPIAIVKTGSTPADFLITITNTHATIATANQEILVSYH